MAFCEIEPYPQAVLRKHWPNVPIYDDIRTLTTERLKADGISVDVITGGFPCQDISSAGKREGINGKQSGLWKEMFRIIKESRPNWVIVENSPDIRVRGYDELAGNLEGIGYFCRPFVVGACHVGASHRRHRAWIIAYSNGEKSIATGQNYRQKKGKRWTGFTNSSRISPNAGTDRVDDGFPYRMDRLTTLGNSVVPQIPEILGKAILQVEEINNG